MARLRKKYICLLLLLFVSACSAIGTIVPVDRRIALQPQTENQGQYKASSLQVNYTYNISGADLKISGNILFRELGAGSLDVHLLVLNSEGAIIAQKIVYSSGYRTMSAKPKELRFNEKIPMSPEATAFSFEYSSRPKSGRQ